MITPFFGDVKTLENTEYPADVQLGVLFLLAYKNNDWTFSSYRNSLEKFFQFMKYKKLSLSRVTRQDILSFIELCRKPPKELCTNATVMRFLKNNSPNPVWRPFLHKLPSQKSLRGTFFTVQQFFDFLIKENQVKVNPFSKFTQKSHFFTTEPQKKVIRKLSDCELRYLFETAQRNATNSTKAAPVLFMLHCCYRMYLRISELTKTKYHCPRMNDFYQENGGWWFQTIGKGNKKRDIAVSDEMLGALKEWRTVWKLTPLPAPDDTMPLFPKWNLDPYVSVRAIRSNFETLFKQAADNLEKDGYNSQAQNLRNATVHWLRHTGISDDVKTRPREHVRDDAGHSSLLITDRYIDVPMQERHASKTQRGNYDIN